MKAVNDAAAYIRSLAQLRGRNADFAEQAVRQARSLPAAEAHAAGVVEVIAVDVADLLKKIDGRVVALHDGKVTLELAGAPTEVIEPDWRNRLLSLLSNPTIALGLLMIGIYSLFIEFSTPGVMAPGIIGAIALLLGLYGLHLLPVNWAGVGLLLLGAALMIAEVFLPTFGVIGIGGIAAFILGGLLLFDAESPGFGVPVAAIVAMALVSAALIIGVGGFALRARRRPVVSGREALIGATGAVSAVEGANLWVQLRGESWQARLAAPSALPVPGAPVRVVAVDGLTLVIEPDAVDNPDPAELIMFLSSLQFGVGALLILAIVIVVSAFRILREYERGVVFLLGRFWRVKGPGLVIIVPGVMQMVRVDLRVRTLDVPAQDVISRDNVSVKVNAIVFFRVVDPQRAIIQVEHFLVATSQLAQTTLRAVLGKHELDEMLAERERLNLDIQRILDAQTDAWGIKVTTVEIKHVDLNDSMVRAIARQAEAERERRAKVIHAEGERQAAATLLEAAQMLARQPEAMQLRYLQTLTQVAGDRGTTILFPLPTDLLNAFATKPPAG